jgi:hypothetical protein
MRSLLALPLAVSLALCALVGCNETDPEALYVDVLYQLRCNDCEPRTADSPARDIHHLDGDQGFDLSCVSEPTGDGRLISFWAEYTDPENEALDYSFEIDQAGLDGTAHGAACSVKVVEGATTYEGGCTKGDPTAEAPCKLSLKKEGDIVRGTVLCDQIPIQDMMNPFRYLRHPNSNRAAEIEVRGCKF